MTRSSGAPSARSRLRAAELELVFVELSAGRSRDQDLTALRRVGDAGRDVDVHPEVIAAHLARLAEMDAGAQLRREAADLDLAEPALGLAAPSTALPGSSKTAIEPSPRRLTITPPWFEIASLSAPPTLLRSSSVASSPAFSAHDEKPTRSVNRIATSTEPRRRRCAADSASQAPSAARPSSPIALGRSAVLVESWVPSRRRSWPAVVSASPEPSSPGSSRRMNFAVATRLGLASARAGTGRSSPDSVSGAGLVGVAGHRTGRHPRASARAGKVRRRGDACRAATCFACPGGTPPCPGGIACAGGRARLAGRRRRLSRRRSAVAGRRAAVARGRARLRRRRRRIRLRPGLERGRRRIARARLRSAAGWSLRGCHRLLRLPRPRRRGPRRPASPCHPARPCRRVWSPASRLPTMPFPRPAPRPAR